jgi:isoleucyl-tRNA synthetase
LAEAEVEYADVRTASIYVSFEVVEGNQFISNGSKLII